VIKKVILRLVLGLVVLVIIAVALLLLFIDPLAKKAVEAGAEYALGVETSVDDLSLGLLDGTLTMDQMRVANPEGFESEHLMTFGRFDLKVRTGSVFSDTVEIEKFELADLDVNIEQRSGGSNVSAVMKNIERLKSKEGKDTEEEQEEGKKVRVDRIVIRNVVAHFHLLPGVFSGGPITVTVPEIELEDVGTGDGEGVSIADLAARLLPAIMAGILDKAKADGIVPAGVLTDLNGSVSAASKALGEGAEDLVRQAGERLEPEAEKEIKKGLDDLFKGLGGKEDKKPD